MHHLEHGPLKRVEISNDLEGLSMQSVKWNASNSIFTNPRSERLAGYRDFLSLVVEPLIFVSIFGAVRKSGQLSQKGVVY